MDLAQEKMELDLELLPNYTTTDGNILRRSNSVLLINELGNNSQVFQADKLRTRTNSTATTGHCLFSPSFPVRISMTRVQQIKQEETMDLRCGEAMHEWELHSAIQINHAWEANLKLSDTDVEEPISPRLTNSIPISPAASPTMGIGQMAWQMKILQRDFSKQEEELA
ncbi:hypothetical protein MUG91_G70n50 [Manis pentadactyla]|nr:hypothetical protein MUG91_G70n50 [Manis pentadactyla]